MIVACDPGSAEGAIVALDLVGGRWHMVAGGAWSVAHRAGGDVMRIAALERDGWHVTESGDARDGRWRACLTVRPESAYIAAAAVESYTAGKRSKGATNLRHLITIGKHAECMTEVIALDEEPALIPPGVWRRTLGVKPRTPARLADEQIRAVVAERVTIPDGAPRWAWRSLPDAAGLGLHLAERLA